MNFFLIWLIGFCITLAYMLNFDLRHRDETGIDDVYVWAQVYMLYVFMAASWPVMIVIVFLVGSMKYREWKMRQGK